MAELSRVYILTDEKSRLIRIEGENTLPDDLTGWILVEQGEPCTRLDQGQVAYLPKPIFTDDLFYRYKWDGTAIVERTEEEIEADREPVPYEPTIEERLNDMEMALCELYESLG